MPKPSNSLFPPFLNHTLISTRPSLAAYRGKVLSPAPSLRHVKPQGLAVSLLLIPTVGHGTILYKKPFPKCFSIRFGDAGAEHPHTRKTA